MASGALYTTSMASDGTRNCSTMSPFENSLTVTTRLAMRRKLRKTTPIIPRFPCRHPFGVVHVIQVVEYGQLWDLPSFG